MIFTWDDTGTNGTMQVTKRSNFMPSIRALATTRGELGCWRLKFIDYYIQQAPSSPSGWDGELVVQQSIDGPGWDIRIEV